MVKPLSEDELRMNADAASVATSVLGTTVEAATRCEQITQDQQMAAFGVGGITRGLMKGMKGMNRAMMPRMGGDMRSMETGGLPKSFVLAVTADKIYAIEDKQDGGKLAPGKVIKDWDREGFVAKAPASNAIAATSGVPDDRQVLILYLPMEGAKTKIFKATAANVAAAGSPGMPRKLMVARDDASQKVIDAIASKGAAGANVFIGGQSVADMMANAQGAAVASDPTEQLSRLADLHDRGVLSDDEFAAQKAKILGAS